MKRFDLVIKAGTIITDAQVFQADLAIEGEKITAIGPDLSQYGAKVIDAEGKYLLPGGIDVHTHLDMPYGDITTSDDFFTGTVAAACGGTTTIIDFANQTPGQSLEETVKNWHRKADGRSVIDYSFHITICDMNEQILKEMPVMISRGYTSFKLFTTYDGLMVSDGVLIKALKQARDYGGLVCIHAENYYMIDYLVKEFLQEGKTEPRYHALSRPPLAEQEAVSRVIKLAQLVEAPLYVVHLSSKEGLAEITRAREAGLPVMAETCPQYLLLSDQCYEEPDFQGAKYVMSPPLRSQEHLAELWKGLNNGMIQVVATDHCPFNFKGQKDLGREAFNKIPNGGPGIEVRMNLLFGLGVGENLLNLNKYVEVTATNPAKIFGMYPQKGTLEVGSDADIVIFDPNLEKTIKVDLLHERVDYTPYEGIKVKGFSVATLSRGEVIVEDGRFVGKQGRGRFLKRNHPVSL